MPPKFTLFFHNETNVQYKRSKTHYIKEEKYNYSAYKYHDNLANAVFDIKPLTLTEIMKVPRNTKKHLLFAAKRNKKTAVQS